MSEFVLCGDALVRASSARIGREQVGDFRESAALLDQAKSIAARAADDAEQARREGYRDGREQALAEVREVLADCVAYLQSQIADEDARRERATSIAAMEAVEQLIGARDDAHIVTGLVRESLHRSGAKPIRLSVAPQWVEAVRSNLGDHSPDIISGDPALDPMGCRIEVEGGRIIADLEKQLSALRERWGLSERLADG
ncbi:MAG: FliH/SctL family protein [Pseudomonadota bacterium]